MSEPLKRRNFLNRLTVAVTSSLILPLDNFSNALKKMSDQKSDDIDPIISTQALGFQWETSDPFLFCVHHEDQFPNGNDNLGPDPKHFNGRSIGDDFIVKDGFRMYHGKTVPGFPGHPHRGFETVTVVRKGMVDHADSMGAAGRYGNGDVQWMTAGKGVQHSEMFPLLNKDKDNPLELFQIWLNLPKKNKMVEPHFKMLWSESIAKYTHEDASKLKTTVEIIAGKLGELKAPDCPPDSWAADVNNEVAIFNIMMDAQAEWTLPKASAGINRTLYFYEGESVTIAGKVIPKYSAIKVLPEHDLVIKCDKEPVSILMLQGKPINEPVIQYGPFVMNTKEEIKQAFEDYHQTQFGGWPWSRYDQVHDKSKGRFAKHADGVEEIKAG